MPDRTTKSIVSKLKLFNIASSISFKITKEEISLILETIKGIFLPMVQSLSKPLTSFPEFPAMRIHEAYSERRAMMIYNNWGYADFLSIALDSSGKWYACIFGNRVKRLMETDSNRLAECILEKLDSLVEKFLGTSAFKEWKDSNEELNFLEGLFRYAAFLKFMESCKKTFKDAVKEEERRIKELRKSLYTFEEFVDVIDPIESGRKSITLPGYSIFSKDSHGENRSTTTYFSKNALEEFWKVARTRYVHSSEYSEIDETKIMANIDTFAFTLSSHLSDIHKAKEVGKTTAESLLGCNYGRLPFSEDEKKILKTLVESLV